MNNTTKVIKKNEAHQKLKIITLAIVVGLLNLLYADNFVISMVVVAVEILILVFCFTNKKIVRYLGNYLIFLTLSFEYEILSGSNIIYGFKNFRVLGINLGIIALTPIVILMLTKKIKTRLLKERYKEIYKFAIGIGSLFILGVFFGALQILVNDNNIMNMANLLVSYISVIYNMGALPIMLTISMIYVFIYEEQNVYQLETYLKSILISAVISMIVALLTNRYGWYGGVATLLVSNMVNFIPFMLLFIFYKDTKINRLLFLFGLVGITLALIYNSNGKLIILTAIIPIGILSIFWKRKKYILFFIVLLLIPLLVLIGSYIINNLQDSSILFNSKIEQVKSILSFWKPNWLAEMSRSPKARVVEIINVIHEYSYKPWFIPFGKGYMGTIVDHIGMLGNTFHTSGYSINQWQNGTFYLLHGTFTLMTLYHGLLGIIFYISIMLIIIKRFTQSIWILIGGYWFLLFYGYSITLSAYGLCALLLGLSQLGNKSNKY